MSLNLSFKTETLTLSVLLVCVCLINSAYAQFGGGPSVPTRSTVVAGVAGEAVPITQKKYVGNVEAIEEVDSIARVDGTLTVAPGFEEGMHVTKGQLLFEIDPVPYQAKVDSAQAAIKQLEAQIDYAQKNYNRLNDLYARQAGSKNDMENAESNLLSLQAQLLSAKAQLVLAQEDLSYTQIKAQIDGRAGRRAYSSGNYVSKSSQPLVKIVQTDPIYVRFTMSERDYLSLYKNFDELKSLSKISLTLPNDATYPLEGEISFIDNTVKSTTDTIKVWATFKNPDEILSPGGVVTVNLKKFATETKPTIKPSAVMFDGAYNYVYILVDSISDEELYKEIKADNRFAQNVEAMEDALKAILNGEDAVVQFLESHKDNLVVSRSSEAISKVLATKDSNKIAQEVIKLTASLGNMKTFGDVEIENNPSAAVELLKNEGVDGWIKAYLSSFKTERYVYTDPQTKAEKNDFPDNKVDSKYLMVLRRNITLGPSNGDVETVTSGIKKNDIVMMDGVHKARPFDLIVPIFRDQDDQEKNSKLKAAKGSPADKAQTNEKVAKSNAQVAKRVGSSKKKVVSKETDRGDGAI